MTGTRPVNASPSAEPAITLSARGVSTTRDGPKNCRSPSVARNTPPSCPTSSPMTMTRSSRSISRRRAERIASIIVISAISRSPLPRPFPASATVSGGRGRGSLRRRRARRGRSPAAEESARDPLERVVDIGLDLLLPLRITVLGPLSEPRQVVLDPKYRVTAGPALLGFGIDIAAGVIGGGMRSPSGRCGPR